MLPKAIRRGGNKKEEVIRKRHKASVITRKRKIKVIDYICRLLRSFVMTTFSDDLLCEIII